MLLLGSSWGIKKVRCSPWLSGFWVPEHITTLDIVILFHTSKRLKNRTTSSLSLQNKLSKYHYYKNIVLFAIDKWLGQVSFLTHLNGNVL